MRNLDDLPADVTMNPHSGRVSPPVFLNLDTTFVRTIGRRYTLVNRHRTCTCMAHVLAAWGMAWGSEHPSYQNFRKLPLTPHNHALTMHAVTI